MINPDQHYWIKVDIHAMHVVALIIYTYCLIVRHTDFSVYLISYVYLHFIYFNACIFIYLRQKGNTRIWIRVAKILS